MFMNNSSLALKHEFSQIQNTPACIEEYICIPKQSANVVEVEMVDCLSFQINLFHIFPGAGLGCLSVYLLICLCDWVSVCLRVGLSVRLSGFFYPDGLGTLPALCHMISLEAAGVKLIWSGLKAYERLMLRINCSHLNSPFPPLKCPSCPFSAPNLLMLTNEKLNWKRNVISI